METSVISMKPPEVANNSTATVKSPSSPVVCMQLELEKGSDGMKEILKRERKLLPRPCPGLRGQKILLMANYFKVYAVNIMRKLYHYDVCIYYDNGSPVSSTRIRRKVLDKLRQTYKSELAERPFAYDGDKSFYTVGPLPQNKLEFAVVLDAVLMKRDGNDQKRQKLTSSSKMFKIMLSFVATISTLRGEGTDKLEILRVWDTALQQHAAMRDCLLLHQSFFPNDPKNFMDLGGGVLACRGFSSSFQAVHGGLYLNFDVSSTIVFQPGPVMDFLLSHQHATDPSKINWLQAKRTLKNLRITLAHNHQEKKVTGLSKMSCKREKFQLKPRGRDQDSGGQEIAITVYDYFVNVLGIALAYSADLPCIDVGKPTRPVYYPIELCSLVSLQRYKKALSTHQRILMVEKSSIKPDKLSQLLTYELKCKNYNADPFLSSCGISIDNSFTQVEGRILPAPRLKVGKGVDLCPRMASWSFKDKILVEPKRIERWAVVNFSSYRDIRSLSEELAKVGAKIGLFFNPPVHVFEENPKFKRKPPNVRVEKMCEAMKSKISRDPVYFILCLVSDKKPSDIYGPWKRKTLVEIGVRNQCLTSKKLDENCLSRLLLKINAKLGGLNSVLAAEVTRTIPLVSKVPTMIFGADVSHSSHPEIPSIAAVVGSRQWPLISCYRASLHTQPRKVQMIDSLFQPVSDREDRGSFRELLVDFYASSGQTKPAHIIIFRNGLSKSQFIHMLNIEMDQIFKACKFLDEKWCPKFTVIVAQRGHHTKLFKAGSNDNIPPGTVVDKKICHQQCNNFFLTPHVARNGTARPTLYHVLLDEVGFTSDNLQEVVHNLSYVFQRCTSAISEVAPIRYARLAAAQISELMKYDERWKAYSTYGGATTPSSGPDLPKLHTNVCDSMFFC